MKITILSPVQHDGKSLQAGDTVEMGEGDARSLINLGAAKAIRQKVDAKSEQKPDGDQPPQGATTDDSKTDGDAAGQSNDASATGIPVTEDDAGPADAEPTKSGAQE